MAVERERKRVGAPYGRERRSALYEWHRRMQSRVGNAVLLWMARRCHRLSERTGPRLGSALGWAMRWISPRHYQIVLTNLRIAFGREKSEEELRELAAACYRHLGKCLTEFYRLPAMTQEELRRIARLEGQEHLDAALARGKGGILLTGHVGNWEMVGARIAGAGYPLNVIARSQRDAALTDYIVRTRMAVGMSVFDRAHSVGRSLRALRRNELVGILLDQNAGEDGIFVDFFGLPASTAPGAAAFALRTDAAVLPTFGWRQEDDTHTVEIRAPVPLIRTGDREHDLRANTAQFTKIIEAQIRKHPAQWFWLHKRWKSRPPQERDSGA